MKTALKAAFLNEYTFLILSFLCLICAGLCVILGDLALPLLIGVLASLYLFDVKRNKAFSYVVSVLLIIINAATFILHITPSLFSLNAIILSVILCVSFSKGQEKSDSAFIMTFVCGAFALVSLVFIAMFITGEYNLESVKSFYGYLTDAFRTATNDLVGEAYLAAGIELPQDVIENLFTSLLSMILSYLFIWGFFIVGLSMKLFRAIVLWCVEDKTEIENWRFKTSNLYAYFYMILVIASIFVASTDDLFSVSILNLYSIFMVVYAYLGVKAVYEMLAVKFKPITRVILLALGLIFLYSIALQVLSAFGAMATIRKNNEEKIKG